MRTLFRQIKNQDYRGDIWKSKGFYKILFLFMGFFATLWFLIRVIPKPSRANYPCMKATMPLAYSFIAYLLSVTGSVVFFRRAYAKFRQKQIRMAIMGLAVAGLFGTYALVNSYSKAEAIPGPTDKFEDPLGPNAPIGEAKGIFPGRVVWAWDPDATNEDCTNSSHSDAYWLDENTDPDVVGQMFSDALQALTGEDSDSAAWEAVFRYFNMNHEKGDTGYTEGETIFIKINAVTAWGGAWPDGNISPGRGIEYDTSPQAIITLLRQLVYKAGVPQEMIYIADPLCDIYTHIYNYLSAEFPDVKYASQYGIPDRVALTKNSTPAIHFADAGSEMPEGSNNNKLFQEMMDADYILNIPTMKGHAWAGVTFFAKNHFGSNTYDGSWYMHAGLVYDDINDNERMEYGMYRVLVDLMGSQYLGRKTLLFFMEALWSTSYEHQKPQRFYTLPFNNDWSSSILLSLDHVAIESVCLDILQKEFTVKDESVNPTRWTYVQYDAIDDYLHQAASSEYWPEGITYDPDNSGTPIPSLGVHEHWNNADDMEYSRNLETGEGIELVKLFYGEIPNTVNSIAVKYVFGVYPNPVTDIVNLGFKLQEPLRLNIEVLSMNGQLLKEMQISMDSGMQSVKMNLAELSSGIYLINVNSIGSKHLVASQKICKN